MPATTCVNEPTGGRVSPLWSAPQQAMPPSRRTAHVWYMPTATWV
jgi:hypothetical protein